MRKTLPAGSLRHRIDIEYRERKQDPGTGGVTLEWHSLHESVPAAVEPISGKEFLSAQAEQGEVRKRITIRYRDDVDETQRVIYRGKAHDIKAVLEDADSGLEYLTLMVAGGVRDG